MQVELNKEWFADFSAKIHKAFGWKKDQNHYRTVSVCLVESSEEQIGLLFDEVSNIKSTKETRELLATIKRWREVMSSKFPRAANAKSATELLQCFIAKYAEGFRLWKNVDGQWFGFFVDNIFFEEENKRSGYSSPAAANINLSSIVFGEHDGNVIRWESSECRGKTAQQLLGIHGFIIEDDEIRSQYEKSVERLAYFCSRIGLQCRTFGKAFGADRDRDDLSSIRYNSHKKSCKVNGQAGLVVVDTVDDKPDEADIMRLDSHMTSNSSLSELRSRLNGAAIVDEEYIDTDDEICSQEFWIPIHPLVPVFDLIRHERYAVHSLDVQQYEYDLKMADKLILPEDQKSLLKLLVDSKGNEFKDIVNNKSGGTVVLLAGKPGLGKTLSAEVFSECSQRPLYRVQCSQLGIDSDTIESELEVVFRRARRWGAVILLDEADLYIGERGVDIHRNAIVCVFLRVLESSDGVLFLTTNLPETVDDAIASRCIARIDVKHPKRESLLSIWDVLLTQANVSMLTDDVEYLCDKYSTMGGRDVKAAIKLAMVNGANADITRSGMEFVLGFHPNRGEWEKTAVKS